MKACSLCHRAARMYCESDQASLCWECDAKVHGANFLVARHSRELLCRCCQAPTPWRAAGARLSHTVSLCERCASVGREVSATKANEGQGEALGVEEDDNRMTDDDDFDDDDDIDDGDEEDRDVEEEEEEDGENQVVPWTLTPPPAASSSSSEESSPAKGGFRFLKRTRKHADRASQMDFPSSSSHRSQLTTTPAFLSGSSTTSSRSSINRQRSLFHQAPPPAMDATRTESLFYRRGNPAGHRRFRLFGSPQP
ncbi:Putative zinc finger protein CONSTANS-LIKE 11 [Apostasia shenzhenica]|uniref:Zinc finger protein CONSTANS-LIKE 11 n=1 Tax=Apostasia shenzhenica TaxID=1088818 RepID=A0A2H9ZXA5_9ASPA|nr:Putative zinc finger protein CONSTANS-LIKE 11 [Apostasia shenzhenica]